MRNSVTPNSESSHTWCLKLPFVCLSVVKQCRLQRGILQGSIRGGFALSALFEFFSSEFFVCVITHSYGFQWTWKNGILFCLVHQFDTLLQPQRDTVLSKSALLYKNRLWPRDTRVI